MATRVEKKRIRKTLSTQTTQSHTTNRFDVCILLLFVASGNSIKAKSPFSCYLHDNLTKNLAQSLSPVPPIYIYVHKFVHCIISYQNKSHFQHFDTYLFYCSMYMNVFASQKPMCLMILIRLQFKF